MRNELIYFFYSDKQAICNRLNVYENIKNYKSMDVTIYLKQIYDLLPEEKSGSTKIGCSLSIYLNAVTVRQ